MNVQAKDLKSGDWLEVGLFGELARVEHVGRDRFGSVKVVTNKGTLIKNPMESVQIYRFGSLVTEGKVSPMNVIQLNIIADESSANIVAGQVVASRRAGDAEWYDPFGGTFDQAEQASLDELARGAAREVRLSPANGRPRVFAARLAAKF